MASIRVLLFSVLNLDRAPGPRCLFRGNFCLKAVFLPVALIRVNTTLCFGWVIFPESLVFIVAIIISSECYLSTLFASRAQCRQGPIKFDRLLVQAYIQASAHHNPSES